jgi:hypothetical protein
VESKPTPTSSRRTRSRSSSRRATIEGPDLR